VWFPSIWKRHTAKSGCATKPQIHATPVSKKEALASKLDGVYTSTSGVSGQETFPAPGGGEIPRNFPAHFLSKISPNEEVSMPLFLSQVAYNEEGWQALVSNPQNRLDAIRPVVDKLGGRIVNAYFAFGDYDFVLISEFPNNVTAAALAIAAAAGGAVKSIKTTPLMDATEGLEAIRKAASSGYRAPSGARPASA
jgi:uncharacterized protein with GYD domain